MHDHRKPGAAKKSSRQGQCQRCKQNKAWPNPGLFQVIEGKKGSIGKPVCSAKHTLHFWEQDTPKYDIFRHRQYTYEKKHDDKPPVTDQRIRVFKQHIQAVLGRFADRQYARPPIVDGEKDRGCVCKSKSCDRRNQP